LKKTTQDEYGCKSENRNPGKMLHEIENNALLALGEKYITTNLTRTE
jgi:hypothetical protein